MKNIYVYLTEHGTQAVITALTGITIVTSAAGAVKVAGNINSFKQKVPEIKTVEEVVIPTATPTVSVVRRDNDQGKDKSDDLKKEEKKDDSDNKKLEIDNDLEVSHKEDKEDNIDDNKDDNKQNLDSEVKIEVDKDSNDQ